MRWHAKLRSFSRDVSAALLFSLNTVSGARLKFHFFLKKKLLLGCIKCAHYP